MGRAPGSPHAVLMLLVVQVTDTPQLTVVVPTHNRRSSVQRLLDALAVQTVPPSAFNVVVVVDGSSDGTGQALRARTFPFHVEVVEQPSLGPAAARNEGARRASSRLLLFLDDDVEPAREVVAAHLALHAGAERRVGVGLLKPVVEGDSLFAKILRYWWTDMQETIVRPGHRFSFKDLLSGHFSISRTQFEALGTFDTALRCHEDYELGFRAIQAGMEFHVVNGAEAGHHDDSTVDKVLRRKFDEGVADIALARRHPGLIRGLPFAWGGETSRKKQALRTVAWSASSAGDAMALGMRRLLPMYEAASLRFRWRALLEALLDYWYWRGIAEVLSHPVDLDRLLASAPPGPAAHRVDLDADLAAAETLLDEVRPAAADLFYRQEYVTTVPAYPGYEALRGAHLRPLLARWCHLPYLSVLARRGRIPDALRPLVNQLEPD